MINSSLDWNLVESKLLKMSDGLKFQNEIRKMIFNIKPSIKILSNKEIDARRLNKSKVTEEILQKINNDIELIEEYILVAKLLSSA